MKGTTWGRTGVLAAAAALAACGGGGGGAGSVTLKSEADVIREIGNATFLQYISNPGDLEPASADGSARLTGYRALMARNTSARQQGRTSAKAYAPMAAETTPCTSGGSYTTESFTGSQYNYSLFGATATSDYTVLGYNDCVEEFDGFRVTTDGRVESGSTLGYSAGTVESPTYTASILGSGSTPFTIKDQDLQSGALFTSKVRGRAELRDNGTTDESRDVVNLDFITSFQGQTFKLGIDLGLNDSPLVVTSNGSTLAVDGPVTYSSDFCDDGRVWYDTLTDLHYDAGAGYFDGGQLLIESGNASVLVTFQPNGDVAYEFDNGASGTIAQSELGSGGGECLLI